MGNANRDRTDSSHSQKDATQSQVPDGTETRRQGTGLTGSVMETPPWDIKNEKATKLGPQHYPTHRWKFAEKEKRGEKKKDMLEKEIQVS